MVIVLIAAVAHRRTRQRALTWWNYQRERRRWRRVCLAIGLVKLDSDGRLVKVEPYLLAGATAPTGMELGVHCPGTWTFEDLERHAVAIASAYESGNPASFPTAGIR